MQQNFTLGGDPLSLDRIRSVLIRLEDTIIFSLIERAQFAHNSKIYERGAIKEVAEMGFQGSWLEWFLQETEKFHAKARRYTSPDEYPFTTDLPKPLIAPIKFPAILHPNTVNVNPSILSLYRTQIVPRITYQASLALAKVKRAKGITGDDEYEDDGNYGSAATIDVEVLQAISKRVHYGKFVSESKFRGDPAAFISHIRNRDADALGALITKPEVELKLLVRVRNKALTYGQDYLDVPAPGCPSSSALGNPYPSSNGVNGNGNGAANGNGEAHAISKRNSGTGTAPSTKIDADCVVELYKDFIIPLTKEVEVEYLLQRLDGLSAEEISVLENQSKSKINGHSNKSVNSAVQANGS